MKTKILLLILGTGLLVVSACTKYPPTDSRLTEDLAIFTQYSDTMHFNLYKTFSISDTVGVITDNNNDPTQVVNANTEALVNQIKKDMANRGFVLVSRNQNPDFGFNIVYFKNTTVTVYSPGWYWGYPGYYPPSYWGGYYGYGYPYYPTYVTSYSTGTIQIDMINLKYPHNNTIYMAWNIYIRALLTGDHNISDITSAVDQAFTQTPQVKTN
jgi:hypothetical protein